MAQAKEAALYALLHAQKHAHSGHPTAKKLLSLASTSVSSGQGVASLSQSLGSKQWQCYVRNWGMSVALHVLTR
jgi:hypothetical protein